MRRQYGIKPIQTRYAGYHFRSRLEARWGVFFDALGLKWEYEKEGYHLPSGQYLPDFWIKDIDSWVEIKPEEPSKLEESLAMELAAITGKDVYIFCNGIRLPVSDHSDGKSNADVFFGNGGGDVMYRWCECSLCGKVGIEYEGRSERLGCKCRSSSDKVYNDSSDRLMAAYTAAMSARFEHGEQPAIAKQTPTSQPIKRIVRPSSVLSELLQSLRQRKGGHSS